MMKLSAKEKEVWVKLCTQGTNRSTKQELAWRLLFKDEQRSESLEALF